MKHYHSNPSIINLLSLSWLLFMPACLFCEAASSTRQAYFANVITGDFRFPGNLVTISPALSESACAISCFKFDNCGAINVNTDLGQCELLSSTPLNPHTELVPTAGWRFYEKTCQLPLQVTGSVQTKNATELWVVADGGASMYTVAFSGDLDVRSVTFWGSTANITGGVFTTLSGVAVVRFSDTQTVKLMLSDSKLFCTVSTSAITAPSASCEGEWPKSVKDLFGEQVGAIISTKQRNGIWAFGGSKIFKVIRSPDGQWELTETHDGATGTLPSIWENIPLNLIGASWIDDSLTKAFLLTKTYYVIYDIKFNSIVKRGYLCL